MQWILHTRITIGQYIYQPAEKTLRHPTTAETVSLSEQCNLILQRLCLASNSFVCREQLIEQIWGDNFETGNKGLNQVIWQLRKAFEALDVVPASDVASLQTSAAEQAPLEAQEVITRLPRKGYQLSTPVTFVWRYAESELPAHAQALQRIDDHVEYSGVQLLLSEALLPLLHALPTGASQVPLLALMKQSRMDIAALWQHIGQLQYELNQQIPGIAFVRQWDGQSLHLHMPLVNSDTDLRNASQSKPTEDVQAVSVDGEHSPETRAEAAQLTTEAEPTHIASPPVNTRVKRTNMLVIVLGLLLALSAASNVYLAMVATPEPVAPPASIGRFLQTQRIELSDIKEKQREIQITDYIDASTHAMETLEKTTDMGLLSQAEVWLQLSKLNLKYDRVALAEKQVYQAKRLHSQAQRVDDTSQTLLLNIMLQQVEYYLEISSHEKAQHLLQQARDNRAFDDLRGQLAYVRLMSRDISLLIQKGQFQRALTRIDTHLAQLERIPFSDSRQTLYSYLLNEQVICLRQLNRLDEAVVVIQRLLALEIEQHGEQHNSAVSRYLSLAIIYLFQSKADASLGYFERAIALNKIIYGEDANNLPLLYNNYSYGLFEAGQPQEALNMVDKAIALQEANFGEQNAKSALYYLTKANHLLNVGDIEQAEKANAQAHTLFELNENKSHPFRGRSLEINAHIHRIKGNRIDCEAYMKMAMQLYAVSYPDDTHWIRKTAHISALACGLVTDETETTQMAVDAALADFADELGENALPVRQIRHKFYPQPLNESP